MMTDPGSRVSVSPAEQEQNWMVPEFVTEPVLMLARIPVSPEMVPEFTMLKDGDAKTDTAREPIPEAVICPIFVIVTVPPFPATAVEESPTVEMTPGKLFVSVKFPAPLDTAVEAKPIAEIVPVLEVMVTVGAKIPVANPVLCSTRHKRNRAAFAHRPNRAILPPILGIGGAHEPVSAIPDIATRAATN
jgi:hypothetical protein